MTRKVIRQSLALLALIPFPVLLGATLLLVIIVRRFIGVETLFGGGR